MISEYEDLSDYDIHPEQWKRLQVYMPNECQQLVDDPHSCGGPAGIGKHPEIGWFLHGSSMGAGRTFYGLSILIKLRNGDLK